MNRTCDLPANAVRKPNSLRWTHSVTL